MATHTLAGSISWSFALIFLALPATLRAQADEWEKHMKTGQKAFMSGLKEQTVWSPADNTPESLRDFAKAEKEILAALAESKTFPPGDARTAQTLGSLANIYLEESKYSEAEERGNQAIALLEASSGPVNPELAVGLARLAMIYDCDGKPEAAAPLWDRSLKIIKNAGPLDPRFLPTIYYGAEKLPLPEAGHVQIYSYIVAIIEASGGKEEELVAALSNLAASQRGPDAEQTLARILEIDRRIDGPDSLKTVYATSRLANLYADEGKYAAALPLLQSAKKVTQRKGPELEREQSAAFHPLFHQNTEKDAEHSQQLDLLFLDRKLAAVYTETGKYPEAEELYKQILSMDEAVANPSKTFTRMDLATDLIGLSVTYRKERKYDDALQTMKRCEKVDEEIEDSKFGKQSGRTGQSAIWSWLAGNEVAEIDREKGDTAAAASLFQQSVDTAQTLHLAPGHPGLARLFDNYATLLRDEAKYDAAESFYKQALDTWARSRYPEHPDVAGTLARYAVLLRKLDRTSEAEALETRASAILAKAGAPIPVI